MATPSPPSGCGAPSTVFPGARDKSLREGLDGSFTYCTLGAPMEVEGMLTGEALPSYPALAAYLLHTASGISAGAVALGSPATATSSFTTNGATAYYLLYEPDLDWLGGNEGILNGGACQANKRRQPWKRP